MDSKVEALMAHVRNEDADAVTQAFSSNKMPTSAIIRELAIVSLMEGILEADIILPRLVVCGMRTISPLHYSALRGADTVLETLLSKASVDHSLSNGSTCLHFACFSGSLSTVKMLLDQFSADINKMDSYCWPALHYASIGGHLEVVEELCHRNTNLMHRDQDGTTAAYRARVFGHYAIVNLFKNLTNCKADLLEPKDSLKNEKELYFQPEFTRKDNVVMNVVSNDKDRCFIEENHYDNPDDLITRIQCKSSSLSQNNLTNSNTNKLSENQIKVGLNIYDIPSDQNSLLSGEDPTKKRNVQKIQALVESQFKDIFLQHDDPYLKPIGVSNDVCGTVTPNHMQNIGFKTLKCLLRSEFQKLRSSYNPVENKSSIIKNDISNERNIYEEITKGSVKDRESRWVRGGQTIRLRQSQRPPLPPRTSIITRTNHHAGEENKDLRNSLNSDISHASQKLNLIEETQVVKEACFNELVYVLEPGDWQKLAKNLPLRSNTVFVEEKIRKIENQFPKDVHKQARTALADWNQFYGKNASLDTLVDALTKSGLVEKIKAVEMASRKDFNV